MIFRFLRVTWFHFYDELGRNLLVNFLALAACVIPLPVLGIPVSLCALSAYANRLIRFQDPEARVFFVEYRRYFWRGLGYGWLYFALFVPLTGSVWFYVTHIDDLGLVGYGLAGICFWMTLYYCAMGFYFFPLVVHQKEGVMATLKRSAFAVLLCPQLAAAAMLVWVAWLGICYFLQPLFLIVPLVWHALSGNAGLLLLLDEYDDEVPDA